MRPMLPPGLAFDRASLLEGKDRLAWSVFVDINNNGEVLDYSIERTVINSNAKLSYEKVERILNGEHHELSREIHLLRDASNILRQKRFDGASNGHGSHTIVAEMMLLANRTNTEFLSEKGLPVLYRVHAAPNDCQLEAIQETLDLFDIVTDADLTDSTEFRKIMRQIDSMHGNKLAAKFLLEHTSRAYYDVVNRGHFALGFDMYAHVTAAGRRYVGIPMQRQNEADKLGTPPVPVEELIVIGNNANVRQRTIKDLANGYDELNLNGRVPSNHN